jgi:hypothetical protein
MEPVVAEHERGNVTKSTDEMKQGMRCTQLYDRETAHLWEGGHGHSPRQWLSIVQCAISFAPSPARLLLVRIWLLAKNPKQMQPFVDMPFVT